MGPIMGYSRVQVILVAIIAFTNLFAIQVEADIPWHKKLFGKDENQNNGREKHANSELADRLFSMDEDFNSRFDHHAKQLPSILAQVNGPNKKSSPPPPPSPPHPAKNDFRLVQPFSDNGRDVGQQVSKDRPRHDTPGANEPPAPRVIPKRVPAPPIKSSPEDASGDLKQEEDGVQPTIGINRRRLYRNGYQPNQEVRADKPPVVDPSGERKRIVAPVPSIKYATKEDNKSKFSIAFKKKMSDMIESTKNSFKPVATIFQPNQNSNSNDKLDGKKALLQNLLDTVNNLMDSVREQYTLFSKNLRPEMEKALNYIELVKLNKFKWNSQDDLDRRNDALIYLATGYEFLRVMMAWRQNTLTGHAAYRLYLETMRDEPDSTQEIDNEDLSLQLEAIHSYILFKSKLSSDEATLGSRLKLDYLSAKYDELKLGSDYSKMLAELRSLYELKFNEFDKEQERVFEIISLAGELNNQFEEVDEYLSDFADSLKENPSLDLALADGSTELTAKLKSQISHNPSIYEDKFLYQLKATLESAKGEHFQHA